VEETSMHFPVFAQRDTKFFGH